MLQKVILGLSYAFLSLNGMFSHVFTRMFTYDGILDLFNQTLFLYNKNIYKVSAH